MYGWKANCSLRQKKLRQNRRERKNHEKEDYRQPGHRGYSTGHGPMLSGGSAARARRPGENEHLTKPQRTPCPPTHRSGAGFFLFVKPLS